MNDPGDVTPKGGSSDAGEGAERLIMQAGRVTEEGVEVLTRMKTDGICGEEVAWRWNEEVTGRRPGRC